MLLGKILTKATVKLNIANLDKWTAIESLTDLVIKTGKISDPGALWNAVLQREKQASTGLENGIALPHARMAAATDMVAAVGISPNGIDFNSNDGKPCHVIFLVAAPTQNSPVYLKMLAEVATLAKDPEAVSTLRKAATPEEVIAFISSFPNCDNQYR